jgi:maleylacetoacetate isomerase
MNPENRFAMHAFWRSSATYRVRVALRLKGLAADEQAIDLDRGEQRATDFLAVNPMGAVPTLIDRAEPDAPPLSQSLAILEFLDETHPEPPLLPRDPHGRARVRSLAATMTADTHPLVVPRIRRYLTENGFDAAAWRRWQIHWFTTGLTAYEQRLVSEKGTGAYSHGDALTIADICMASVVMVARVFDIAVANTPTVDRIMAACEAQPAFAAANPWRQAGAPPKS